MKFRKNETDIPNEVEDFVRSEKLKSVGVLAGGIAQDFNALLSVIIGNITLARMEVAPGDKTFKLLEEAEKASLQAAELAERLITFSNGGWLVKREEKLSTIFADIKDSYKLDTNVEYVFDIPRTLPTVFVDEGQIKQALLNVLKNSAEALSPGGRVYVKARKVELRQLEYGVLQPGEYIMVIVEDQGKGIPKDDMGKIFDPYFSTKDSVSQMGMGLGLSICYSILEKHKGHVTVESEPGRGTTVILYIPVFDEEKSRDPVVI